MGVGEGYGLKTGSSYMHIIVQKTRSKISASCEENNNHNRPSIPTNFFNDCSFVVRLDSHDIDYLRYFIESWEPTKHAYISLIFLLWLKLKVLATIPYFSFYFFPHLLIFLQFRDPFYVLNLSTTAVLQKWHN